MKRFVLVGLLMSFSLVVDSGVQAGPPPKPNPQQFDFYDNTEDGLQPAVDPDIGNVRAVANPGGKERVILQLHIQHTAPDCTFQVQLLEYDHPATNGGLNETGHHPTVEFRILGTLTTNGQGNGNAHFDFSPSGDGNADNDHWGHIDLENPTCMESDGTNTQADEYGAAPDPALGTPFTWYE